MHLNHLASVAVKQTHALPAVMVPHQGALSVNPRGRQAVH